VKNYKVTKEKYREIQQSGERPGFGGEVAARESNLIAGTALKEMYEELEDNLETLSRQNNQPIRFGQEIQLLNMDSHKYLSFLPQKKALNNNEDFAVELAEEFSDLTTFKLQPVFYYQQNNGGLVLDEDEVYIVSCAEETKGSFEPYLSKSDPKSKLSIDDPKASDEVLKPELSISVEKSVHFRVKLFSDFLDGNENLLKVNDVIWITYNQFNINLECFGGENPQNIEGKFGLKSESGAQKEIEGNSKGMFSIENFDDNMPGGYVQWGKPYKLKHLP
jgi:hypothetical protein